MFGNNFFSTTNNLGNIPNLNGLSQYPNLQNSRIPIGTQKLENELQCRWVNSFQEAQNQLVNSGSQMLFVNMNEAEIYFKVRDVNGLENISTFTITAKDKPKEVEKKEKQDNLIENLFVQNNAILEEIKNIKLDLATINNFVSTGSNENLTTNSATLACTNQNNNNNNGILLSSEMLIYGGK